MSDWKIHTNFRKTGFDALVEEKLRLAFEKGSGEAPGYLTIDIYPDRAPKYPRRHFGNWQFQFADLAGASEIVLTVNKDGAKLIADGKTIPPLQRNRRAAAARCKDETLMCNFIFNHNERRG